MEEEEPILDETSVIEIEESKPKLKVNTIIVKLDESPSKASKSLNETTPKTKDQKELKLGTEESKGKFK